MSEAKTGQVNTSAAKIYEEFFIPALFQEWAVKVADQADVRTGQAVLDVACGTGVLAREVFEKVGSAGSVTGLDINEGMLAVAEEKQPGIIWKRGAAESIPFEDETFDAVVSQFGLMFFADQTAALEEMLRVLGRGGKLVVAVWDSLENVPGYREVVQMLDRLFGDEVANALRSPYSLGDIGDLKRLFGTAGIDDFEISTVRGLARFPSIESWMFTDIKGWTLADMIDKDQYQLLLDESIKVLRHFALDDGRVEFEHPAHIISYLKQ